MDKREYKELSELAANGGTKAFARLYETVYREMYYTAFYTLWWSWSQPPPGTV